MPAISVARLIHLRIAIAWQEAVEVAAAAGQRSATDGIPISLERCTITTEGTVQLSTGSATHGAAPLSPMQLLGALIEGQAAPAELRALVAASGDVAAGPIPARSGVTGRQPDLSWFQRPDPEAEIARLAARGLAADAEAGVASELSRLRAGASEPPSPATATARTRWTRLARLAALSLAVVLMIGVVAVAGRVLLSWRAAVQSTAGGGETGTVPATERATPGSVRPEVGAARPVPGAAMTAAPNRAGPGSARTAPAADPIAVEPAVASAGMPAPAVGDRVPALPDVMTAPDSRIPVADDRVYSSRDGEVIPPVLMHPKLPTEARTDTEQTTSAIEVVVDASGQVTQARLQSGGDVSLNDRMLVAAAKAWRFHPATRDGRPVPYVLRVPVTR